MTKAVVKRIKLSDIESDIDLQARASIDSATVEEYAQVPDKDFPPIVVFQDAIERKFWMGDGWHRFFAAGKRGQKDILCEIREGSRRDALLFSCGANANHGLKRTPADKRRAVHRLLEDPEWTKWSNVAIADAAAVSAPFVLGVRKSMEESGAISEAPVRITRDGTKHVVKPSTKRETLKRDESERYSPIRDKSVIPRPQVAPIDADMPERYEDNEGNDVPEALFPVWQRVDDYARISNRIRESGVTEALAELKAIGTELGCKDTVAYADESIEKIRLIVAGVKQRAPAFVRGEGWSSMFSEFLEASRDE